jgi:integrase
LELLPTKTVDSQRSIRLPRIVIDKLRIHKNRQEDERRLAGSDWRGLGLVFTTTKGTPLEPRNMLREYYRLRDRADLPSNRFHDLRHSAATILKEAGLPDEVIQKLLGHASVRTTQEVYMHLTTDAEKRAATKMDEIFGSVAVTVADKNAAGEQEKAANH